MTLVRTPLHSDWTVRASHGPAPETIDGRIIPAAVPGVVHTDLLSAGLIPDPYLDDNESLLAWIGLVDWTYETTFEWTADAHTRHDLVFDGLDTVATVRLNGHAVLEAANQHRTYRADVRDALVEGTNRLEVAFRSPVR
ncbi:MAG TPA: glycoside hydrolase family 2 protein, partial [Microbacterium sp.]|nr:glycoside hydrolase family 2 protein [Microbacterium sp.]